MTGRAVVIGASGAIGNATAQLMVERGWDVIAVDLGAPNVPGAREQAVVDVTDASAVSDLFDRCDSPDPVTAVVYAAGLIYSGPVADTDWAQYDRVMNVNLGGAFHTAASIASVTRSTPRAISAVFLSSVAGITGEPGGSVYCASKFALRGLVQSLAGELASHGGRANSVCPGNVDSPMLRRLAVETARGQGVSETDVLRGLAASSAFNRLLLPREVAETCEWLCSARSSGISGQSIVVDGPPLPRN